jgi:hypothetical protein
MRTPTTLTRLAAPAAALLVLAACSGTEDGELASIGLEEGEGEVETDSADAADAAGDADDGGSNDDAVTDDDVAADDGGDSAQDTDEASTQPDDVVDLTEAIPGTWPVGDAGTVTFSIVDGALVLDDVTANDGWMMAIDEQDVDEIEVDFIRGNVEWEIEIELEDDGRILEIEIDQDIEPADPGSYDIGDAGTFAFSVVDGRLVLDDLNITDGWTLVELDEEADEIEFELVNGPRSFDVEVELEDDGTIEVEIDYEVTGPVTG